MRWNWQLPDWPNFIYDSARNAQWEKKFLLGAGSSHAFLKNVEKEEYDRFVVEILSSEGLESSRIEGEILDRASLQSSIRQHFGLKKGKQERGKEAQMAKSLCDVYATFDKPLTHKMLHQWHEELFRIAPRIEDLGKYRTHKEPMQIVSGRYDVPTVFFEAPPSAQVPAEMDQFVQWFNKTRTKEPILTRAAIAHLYFESIHPFEDGNGRVGRFLVEKVLSQGVGRPTLIAVSRVLERRRNEYYAALERCNRTLEVDHWVEFFSEVIVQAQEESLELLHFLIRKSKMLNKLSGQLNPRQEKALLRMFAEGPEGFTGGLSSEKYVAITKASKATATRDLADLVEKGALRKTGELRYTRYWLNL